MNTEQKARDEAEVDRLLGNLALVKLGAMQGLGGPSSPTLYRAAKAGLIEIVRNGRSAALRRGTAKQILLEGLPKIDFKYGDTTGKK
jgi:hypothetical protein